VRSRKLLLGVRHFGGCYTGPSPRCRRLADLARAQVLRPRCQSVETLSEQMPAKTTRSATLSCGASKAACRLSTRISQTACRAHAREPPITQQRAVAGTWQGGGIGATVRVVRRPQISARW
jgi:hypothetical protein